MSVYPLPPPVGGKSQPPSSVQKASRILKAMSDARSLRLTEIAELAGLDKATTLRLLDTLAQEGFVSRDERTKHYTPGPEMLVLGAAALARFDPRPIVQPSLLRLADRFEDTIILSVPDGNESLCLALQTGRYPIRANYLAVGGRRLLGVGAGSLALLAWMPERETEVIMPSIEAALAARHPRITRPLIEQGMAQARERGYAMTLNIVVDRMGGLAVPIFGADGYPAAALSIAALSDRITAREAELADAFRREAALCESLWNAPHGREAPPAPRRNGTTA